jgi:hypothetical protein
MRFHIEPQQLAKRVCEVVFFFLGRIAPRTPDPTVSLNCRSIPTRIHLLRDSQN